jgi:hypothetical protein
MTLRPIAAFALGSALLSFAGCRDDSNAASTGSSEGGSAGSESSTAQQTSTGQGGSSQTGAGQGGSSQTGAGQGGSGCPEGGAPPGQGATSCDAIEAVGCFSNYDCAAAERCENVGTLDLPVACCVPGARGTGQLGDPCASERDCASSLCIDVGVCGGTCTDVCTSEGECPAELPQCIPIAFSGSDASFCLP